MAKKPANTAETHRKRTVPRTAWKKGQPSPNPSGRPKTDAELVEAFRARTPKALATLDKVLEDYGRGAVTEKGDPLVPSMAAVKAAEVLLDRGWGTAPAVVRLEGEATVQVQHTAKVELGPERLQRVAMLLERVGVLEQLRGEVRKLETGGEVVDVKPESEEPGT